MPTHLNLRTYLLDFLGTTVGRTPATYLTLCLNIAQRNICREWNLPFNEEDVSLSLVAGTRTVAIPDGSVELEFARPWLIQYTDPDDATKWIIADERRYDFMLETYGNDAAHSTGDPIHYAVFDDLIYFGPTPKRNITAKMTYYGILKDLSADGDNNDLTNRWWPLLLYKAAAIISAFMFEADQVQLYESAFKQELDRVLSDHERRTFGGQELSQMIEAG